MICPTNPQATPLLVKGGDGSGFGFNPAPSSVMLLDINSCFATIEQQANPLLRGKPLVVAAYPTPSGCILASSVEAKKLGIKTGMRVRDGQAIYPRLIVLPCDPDKYRHVHHQLFRLLSDYTSSVTPRSIDEFALHFDPSFIAKYSLLEIATEIKSRIKTEIGDWLTVSIGIGPNRFLAKMGSNLQKPDGLVEISLNNFLLIYQKLNLTDLHGIKKHNALRLNLAGIYTVPNFYQADILL